MINISNIHYIGILPLFSCSTFLPEKYTAEVPTCQCLPAFPDKDNWYGGDGAYSIQLDTERTLWLFGDTFVAHEKSRKDRIDMDVILGTTMAISTCSENCKFKIQYYLKKQNGKFVSSFGGNEWSCYAGKEHIEFSGDGNLVVTYACNSVEDFEEEASFIRRNLFLYRPVVIQVPWAEK